MKLLVFGSATCDKCKSIRDGLKTLNIEHTYLDGDEQENSDNLDRWDVDELPYVRLLDENDNVAWHKSGNVSLTQIIRQKKKYEAERTAE